MQGLILDANEFKTEREVVKEERRLRNEDDPQGALVEALFAQAFMSHPYHWPVIGWFSDLDAMNLDDLQRHYDTYYSPNNATLIVVGDIKADTLLPTIAKLFEPIPKGPSPKPLAVTEEQKNAWYRHWDGSPATRRTPISPQARSAGAVRHDGLPCPQLFERRLLCLERT